MKKLLWFIICLMAINVNAQKINLMRIKQAAVNYHKTTLKAPSTFILTDRYGNKIPISSVQVEFKKGYFYEREEKTCYFDKSVDEYISNDTMLVYKSYIDDVYEVSFRGESQNSYGGMVSNFHVYYVDKRYNVHNSRPSYQISVYEKCRHLEKCKLDTCNRAAKVKWNGYCSLSHENEVIKKEQIKIDSLKREQIKTDSLKRESFKTDHSQHIQFGDCLYCANGLSQELFGHDIFPIECEVCKKIHKQKHKKHRKKYPFIICPIRLSPLK